MPNFRHEINGKKLASAIVQDYETDEVLMLAFIDEEAYEKSVETKKAHYYSTSRDKIWYKGEESGHVQEIKEILFDCDMDALYLKLNSMEEHVIQDIIHASIENYPRIMMSLLKMIT